jgi:hypothetical protein
VEVLEATLEPPLDWVCSRMPKTVLPLESAALAGGVLSEADQVEADQVGLPESRPSRLAAVGANKAIEIPRLLMILWTSRAYPVSLCVGQWHRATVGRRHLSSFLIPPNVQLAGLPRFSKAWRRPAGCRTARLPAPESMPALSSVTLSVPIVSAQRGGTLVSVWNGVKANLPT